jgi:hypothetical protein
MIGKHAAGKSAKASLLSRRIKGGIAGVPLSMQNSLCIPDTDAQHRGTEPQGSS